jgi:hypothetical protein
MLTARVERFEPAIATFGALRQDDINLALAMVRALPARLLIRIKYADDPGPINDLEGELLNAIERGLLQEVVSNIAAPKRWRIPRPGFLRDLCRLALYEAISPPLCAECKGRGHILPSKKKRLKQSSAVRDCDRCAATGKGNMKETDRCRILDINPDTWCKHWKEKYSAIRALIDRYEAIGLNGMAKRLRA